MNVHMRAAGSSGSLYFILLHDTMGLWEGNAGICNTCVCSIFFFCLWHIDLQVVTFCLGHIRILLLSNIIFSEVDIEWM